MMMPDEHAMRYLLECGHYAIGRSQLIGDRRLCDVCPRHDSHGMSRMIVHVVPVSADLVSDSAPWVHTRARSHR